MIKASKQVDVGSQVTGEIKSLNIKLGQHVKQGDLIAVIDQRAQQNALQTQEAQLTSYQAILASKQASLIKAQLDLKRQTTMYKAGASSKENYDAAVANHKLALAEIVQAKSQIKQAQISTNTARLNLSYTQIKAPIDGIVVRLPVEQGQTLNATQNIPSIATIAQLDTVMIKAEISEADVGRLQPNLPAYFTTIGNHQTRYDTTLLSIDPAPTVNTDNATSSVSANTSNAVYYYGIFKVPNSDLALRMGMTVNVAIILKQVDNALIIPSAALGEKKGDDQYKVQVQDANGELHERWVKVGINNNIRAEILEGLTEGEEVVVKLAKPKDDAVSNQPADQ